MLLRILVATFLIFGASPSHAQDHCLRSWGKLLNPGPQKSEQVGGFRVNGEPVVAIEFTPLTGDFQKKYAFFRFKGDCIVDAVTFGSYELTTVAARASGSLGPDDRSYHADYYANDEHATIGFFNAYPSFEEARSIAGRFFLGEIKPRSSSRRGAKKTPKPEQEDVLSNEER